MTLAHARDLDEVQAGLAAWLAARPDRDATRVVELRRPAVGWSCETIVATLEVGSGTERLVLRLPPAGDAIFPSYDLELQAGAQTLAGDHGVPTAAPVEFEPDPSWLGAPFLTMPFVVGHVPGEFLAGDRWIAGLGPDGQAALWSSALATLAAIHRVEWRDAPIATRLRGAGGGVGEELAWWGTYLDWSCDGAAAPALRDALDWCCAHAPGAGAAPSLLWGDVRLGNLVVDERTGQPRAVLDWDLVSVGPAEMDLGWLLALEAVTAELAGIRVDGFPDHDASVHGFERALGRPVRDLAWHEIFALVRSTAILDRIATLFRVAGTPPPHQIDVTPILAIVDRRITTFEPDR